MDYELEEFQCPKCEHYPTHSRECDYCNDGLIEDDDPFWVNSAKCHQCNGQGWECWCPNCGADLTKKMIADRAERELDECYPLENKDPDELIGRWVNVGDRKLYKVREIAFTPEGIAYACGNGNAWKVEEVKECHP
jgi:hypothetical protein